MNIRTTCAICQHDKLNEFYRLNPMPVFMGTVPNEMKYKFQDMTFVECLNCGEVQLGSYPSISDLYLKNHNVDVVGQLWNSHFDSFSDFIGSVENKRVLEISDPSAKLAKRCDKFKKWTIIEMNPFFEATDNIDVIKDYFSYDLPIDIDVDVIVHSHFFEHSLNPSRDLKKMWEILPESGDMFFSIPDIPSLIQHSNSPTALNFEHTYYYDLELLSFLLETNGFEVVKIRSFKNHSIFVHAKKSLRPARVSIIGYRDRKEMFVDCFGFHRNNVNLINTTLEKCDNTFIYGAHVTSQFYIFNGLNVKLMGTLDKSASKNGEILYGTELRTFYPEELLNHEEANVIVSHSSVYKNEIIENIKSFAGNRVKLF